MEQDSLEFVSSESKILVKCILKGLTIEETAQKLACSKSCVCYKTKLLLKKFNAKTKFDFIIKIFSDILNKNKIEIKEKNIEISRLKKEFCNLKKIIKEIFKNIDNKEKLLSTLEKFKNFTY